MTVGVNVRTRSTSLTLSRLTPRISCGARTQPRFRHRPPARRQLQPVVSQHGVFLHFVYSPVGHPSVDAMPQLSACNATSGTYQDTRATMTADSPLVLDCAHLLQIVR